MSHAKKSAVVNTYFMIRTVVMTASTITTNSATRAADKAVMIVLAWLEVAAGDNQAYNCICKFLGHL